LIITGVSIIEMLIILFFLKPINAHIKIQKDRNAFRHLLNTAVHPDYLWAFVVNTLLIMGGYMLMPFGSAFAVNNLGIAMTSLPMLYFITGIFSMTAGPIIGRISDRKGKYTVFRFGSVLAILVTLIYTNLGRSPLWLVIALNVILMVGFLSRIISSSALLTAVPDVSERGAFMGVNSSIAGFIVFQTSSGALRHYDTLGYIVSASMIVTIIIMKSVSRYVNSKPPSKDQLPEPLPVIAD
jgi:predicted MFS family arabinose efflux permease